MAWQRRRTGFKSLDEDLRSVRAYAIQASLVTDSWSMDQKALAAQAKQFSHTIQRAHGEPAGACVVAQQLERSHRWRF